MIGSKQFDLNSLFALMAFAGLLAFYFVDPTIPRFLIVEIGLATGASIWGGLKFDQPIRYSVIACCIWSLCVLLLGVSLIVADLELVREDNLTTFNDNAAKSFFAIVFIFLAISLFVSATVGMIVGFAVKFAMSETNSDRERRITIR